MLKTLPPHVRAPIKEIVESDRAACSHNVLMVQTTEGGAILDFSGGQFTGQMLPSSYTNAASFKAALLGEMLAFKLCPEMNIRDQIERDASTASTHTPYHPEQWAPVLASSFLDDFLPSVLGDAELRGDAEAVHALHGRVLLRQTVPAVRLEAAQVEVQACGCGWTGGRRS